MKSFENSSVLVTGGTGSFGSTMVKHLLSRGASEVRVLSRDELKQDVMRRSLAHPSVNYILGDTRDADSMRKACDGVNYVFHAAALKQVPSGDFFPLEVTKTNVFGSSNVIRIAEDAGVESLVVLSTDKAVYPINAMGMSKGLMEKVAVAEARRNGPSGMRVNVTRYGNVMMSRGSVIPAFLESAMKTNRVSVTSMEMTRFMMSLSESVDLVEHALLSGSQGSIFVRKAPAASLETLVEALRIYLDRKLDVQIVGVRHGEKMHETLVSAEEMAVAIESENYLEINMDSRDLDYESYFERGREHAVATTAYTSSSGCQLSPSELAKLIQQLLEQD